MNAIANPEELISERNQIGAGEESSTYIDIKYKRLNIFTAKFPRKPAVWKKMEEKI